MKDMKWVNNIRFFPAAQNDGGRRVDFGVID